MGEYRISENSVELRIVGCGDAFGSGGRFQTCFLIHDSYGCFLIDFGASSLVALNAQNINPSIVDLIILSHLHGDHYGALPNLLLQREYLDAAKTPLTIAGPPGFPARLQQLADAMFPGAWRDHWSFPLDLIELEPGRETTVVGRNIKTVPVTHYAGLEPSTAMRISTSGKVIAYSGDTGWNECLVEISQDSDVFLCDCNDRHDELFEGHLSYETLTKHRDQIYTKRLILTHLGPHMIGQQVGPDIEVAFDGLVVPL